MKPLAADDPRVIGEYRLRAQLGAGGMGRVYLGLSPAGRAVAIKVVHPDLASDGAFLRRFGQEVAAARAVSGIYTAPVVASGLNERPPWLATAFVPGLSLVTPVPDPGERCRFYRAFGGGQSLMLVRPDAHVCVAGRQKTLPRLLTWLNTWFPPGAGGDPPIRRRQLTVRLHRV